MSKFKVGDEVVLVAYDKERDDEKSLGFIIGCKYKISDVGLYAKIENENDFIYVDYHQIKISDSHQTSNRSKLREHVKSLGFSAIDLSVAAGFNKAYFGSETGESRFNSRGDISDDRLLKHKASEAKKKLASKSIGKLTVDLEVKTTFVSDQSKESIEKLPENKPEKLKSKWIVSNKVFSTFVFFFLLLILFIVTGVVKQVF